MQYRHKGLDVFCGTHRVPTDPQAATQATPGPSPTPPTPPSTSQDLWWMLLQHLLEVPARMAGGMLRHLLRRARHHDLATLIAPFWSQINDPVGTADHIEVVLRRQEIPEWA